MTRDPAVFWRRLALLAAAALFGVVAVMNLSNLAAILAREEPRRSLRLFLAASSFSLGSIMIALFVLDLRHRVLPLGVALRPAWLIVGLNLVDEYFPSQKALFMVTGCLAVGVGFVAIVHLFLVLRRRATA